MGEDDQSKRTRVVTWSDPAEAREHLRRLSGAELFDKMRRGEIPNAPFARLIGIEVFDAGEGRFTMTLVPQECHYNPMGCVHGGILATLLDSVMSAAVHTALPAGQNYMTTGINVNFLKPVFERTGEVMAEGKLVSLGRLVATAEGRILDQRGELCATGTASCVIMDGPARKREAARQAKPAGNAGPNEWGDR